MSKFGIFSKHLVLTSHKNSYPNSPVAGIILINEGKISEIQLTSLEYCELTKQSLDYDLIDYSDFYVSPGLIDLNVRQEWEDLTSLTQAAISGGVTFIAVEKGFYHTHINLGPCYCDVAFIPSVGDNFSIESLHPNTLAIKAYFFPPAPGVKTVANLENFMKIVNNYNIRLFIDPTLPDSRLLYMASPLRLFPIEDRRDSKPKENTFFAAAFPNSVVSSGDESEQSDTISSEEILDASPNIEKIRKLSLLETEGKMHRKKRSVSDENEELLKNLILIKNESESTFPKKKKKYHTIHNIYMDLDERIKACQNDMKDLSVAEQTTYLRSGSTSFISEHHKNSSLTHSPLPNIDKDKEPSSAKVLSYSTRKELFRPSNLQIKTISKPETQCYYIHHLANYPENWELSGIEKLVEFIEPHSKIHFQGISSVGALNRIRQLKQKFKKVTCEIPAPHLFFNSDSVPNGDTRFKNAPPIRNRGNFNLLWDLLKMRGIDIISSQHVDIEGRFKPFGNFHQALNGISSLGMTLQAVWTTLNIPISSKSLLEHYIVRLAKWLSLQPAQIIGQEKLRGSIEVGKWADLVIWDPWERNKIGQEIKYPGSPFVNQEVLGTIKFVYFKGELVNSDTQPYGQVMG